MTKPLSITGIFRRDISYVEKRVKDSFHSTGRARLRKLAQLLNLQPGTYEIRSNQGGIAVSGEIILHHDKVYVQISQAYLFGHKTNVMFRSCKGRKDYTGGPNNWAGPETLDDVSLLAAKIRPLLERE